MKTLVFTCDVCKESKSREGLVDFTITVGNSIRFAGEDSYNRRKLEKDICKDCLRKKGFNIETPSVSEEATSDAKTNAKTLESKFLDILEDLGVMFSE